MCLPVKKMFMLININMLLCCSQQSAKVSDDDKSAQQALRRQFARQQAKDLAEHTKQLHGKDMELEALRQQLSKVGVCMASFLIYQCHNCIINFVLLTDHIT